MEFVELLREIESHSFAARVNVASDVKTFLRGVWHQAAVISLFSKLEDKNYQSLLLNKISDLAQLAVDQRYENPNDTALAVYLWVLSFKSIDLATVAASIAAQASQCWWAKHFSSYLLAGRLFQNQSETQEMVTLTPSRVCENLSSVDSEESIFSFMPHYKLKNTSQIVWDGTLNSGNSLESDEKKTPERYSTDPSDSECLDLVA